MSLKELSLLTLHLFCLFVVVLAKDWILQNSLIGVGLYYRSRVRPYSTINARMRFLRTAITPSISLYNCNLVGDVGSSSSKACKCLFRSTQDELYKVPPNCIQTVIQYYTTIIQYYTRRTQGEYTQHLYNSYTTVIQ